MQIKRLTLWSAFWLIVAMIGGAIVTTGKIYTLPQWLEIVGSIMAFTGSGMAGTSLIYSPIPVNSQTGKVDPALLSTKKSNY